MQTETRSGLAFTVEVKISETDIRSLLVSAFESGSTYWAMISDASRVRRDDEEWPIYATLPLEAGGWIEVTSVEEPERPAVRLDRDKITKGLELLAQKCPSAFASIVTEDCDMGTADEFLQHCIYGESIYG